MTQSATIHRGQKLASSGAAIDRLRAAAPAERERAWRELYEGQFDRVYRMVCRFGIPTGEVEDLVQTVFMRAHGRLVELGDIRDVGAWLRGIVVRVVAEHRRWRRLRELKAWLLRDRVHDDLEEPPTPERLAATSQSQARVQDVLGRMSGKLRDVLVLCDIEQCQPAEVGELLGIPVNTVRSRRRLAREQFLALWRQRFGELDKVDGP
jgi:RNA polymerase sigma-70 factor (ECF subfamily)